MRVHKSFPNLKRGAVCFVLLTMLFSVLQTVAFAQVAKKRLTGTVKSVSGEALPGVNVIVKGTGQGASTSIDGKYSIENVDVENAAITISFVGYTTQTIKLDGRTAADIILKEDAKTIDEVVVIGYGSLNKKELSSSIVSVSKDNFTKSAISNPMEMIAGKVAGLNVNSTAAANPNSGPSLQIRGATSLSASNDPLVVINGIPGGDLRNLSPQDIESITVLKDGASSAIYGTRGANGVILVTTKQGSGAVGTQKITYDSWFGVNIAKDKPKVLSADEFRRSMRGNDYGYSTDWYNQLLRDFSFDNNQYVALDGTTQRGYYGASFNYKKATGLDIANERNEYGGRFSILQRGMDSRLEISGSLNARKVEEKWGDDSQFDNALSMNPTMPVFDPKGGYYHPTSPTDARNPVEELTDHLRGGDRIYILGSAEAKLHIIKTAHQNFNTSMSYSLQYNDLNQHDYVPSTSAESAWQGYAGRATLQYQKWTNRTFEWLGNYSLDLGEHSVKAVAGYSYQDFTWESRWMENKDFPYDNFQWYNMGSGGYLAQGKAGMSSGKSLSKLIGLFGRVNYNWKGLIMASASLRYEGSTKFGDNNKWGYFPAGSVAWEMSKMSFMENLSKAVNSLKLRVSYGVTGRSDFNSYMSLPTYSSDGKYLMGDTWIPGFGPSINANPDLKWERGINTNIGLDFVLYNRIRGSVDYFDRTSKDLLYTYKAPQPPMIYDNILVNVGSISNKGLEATIEADVVKGSKFSWTSGVIYSYGTTKLSKLSNSIYKASYLEFYKKPGVGTTEYLFRVEDGGKIGQFYGYKHAGIDKNGNLLVYNKDGKAIVKGSETPEDKQYIGNGVPTSFLSFSNTLRYGNFDLNIFMRGAFGFDIMNFRRYGMGLQMSGTANVLREAYTKYGDITKDGGFLSSFYLEKGDYMKFENVTLGYTLPLVNKYENKFIEKIRLFVSGRNLYTITGYTGNDPSTVNVNGLTPGVDVGSAYPSAVQVSAGVTINFK